MKSRRIASLTAALCTAAAVFVTAPGASANAAWIVDTTGAGDFTAIQSAVDAALEGDMVLIKGGAYTGDVVVDGRSILITEEAGEDVVVTGTLTIRDLAADDSVTVRGLQFDDGQTLDGVRVLDSAGPVFLEEVTTGQGARFEIERSDAVTLVHCSNMPSTQGAGSAVLAIDSEVHLYECDFVGSTGPSGDGEPAAELQGGFLFTAGSSFTGGAAIAGDPGAGCIPKDGGDGLTMNAGTQNPAVVSLDTIFAGGANAAPGSCDPGADGLPIRLTAGVFQSLPGTARGASFTSPVRDGEPMNFHFTGQAGDGVFLLLSLGQAPFFKQGFSGALLPAAPVITFLGNLPAGGILSFDVPAPQPPIGIDGMALYQQAAYTTTAGTIILSEPRVSIYLSSTL